MGKLKILVVVSCFPPSKGGVERSSYRLAMGLASRGHEVTVVTSSRGMKPGHYTEQMGPLKVIRYPETRYLFDAPILPRIALAALREDYDVLHVHGMTPSVSDLSILFAKLRGKRVVLTYHNDAQSAIHGFIGRLAGAVYSKVVLPVIWLADHVVSTTFSYAATSPVLRHVIDAVTIIPWGTDFAPPPERAKSADEAERKRVLFVGQLKRYKGVDILLDSLAMLNGRGHFIGVDIVGSGPELEDLKSRARRLVLEERVKFWGTVEDETLKELYEKCDTVVLPSINRREAFGLAILDALAAGKPVVASDIPGVREVALLGGGYLTKPNDPAALSESILNAVMAGARGPDELRQAAEALSWDSVLVKYDGLLRSLSGGLVTCVSSLSIILAVGVLLAIGSLASPSTSPALAMIANF